MQQKHSPAELDLNLNWIHSQSPWRSTWNASARKVWWKRPASELTWRANRGLRHVVVGDQRWLMGWMPYGRSQISQSLHQLPVRVPQYPVLFGHPEPLLPMLLNLAQHVVKPLGLHSRRFGQLQPLHRDSHCMLAGRGKSTTRFQAHLCLKAEAHILVCGLKWQSNNQI